MIKKIFISSQLFFFTLIMAFGNDSYIDVSGGALTSPEFLNNENIQMISEKIVITLYDEYYNTNVDFEFYNKGENQTISVGFPQWSRGTTSELDFINFSAKYNGITTEFEEISVNEIDPLDDRYVHIKKWFVRELEFESNKITETSVNYDVPYGTYGNSAEYLYGTGSTWDSVIKEMHLEIINESDRWINEISFDSTGDNYIVNHVDGIVKISQKNVKPNLPDLIIMFANSVPFGLLGPRRINPDRYWYYESVELKPDEMKYLSKLQLRLLRNLLFAAHGHEFRSRDINKWLTENCSDWYEPMRKVSIEEFNSIEKYNLETIQNEESNR